MKRYLRLIGRFYAQHFKAMLEYRFDFYLGLFGFMILQSMDLIFVYLIFQQIPQLNGWAFEEILFIYGFFEMVRGLDHLFTDNLWILAGSMIVNGDFDRYLLRPVRPLFHLLAERFQTDGFGEFLLGIVILVYSIIQGNLNISWQAWTLMPVLVICGVVILSSLKLLFASLSFWFKRSDSLLQTVYVILDFAKYPVEIYGKIIRGIISFVLPLAFIAFFPAAWIMGKMGWFKGVALSAILALGISLFALWVWKRGIRAYESAGH